jgi:cell division septation protein DedD
MKRTLAITMLAAAGLLALAAPASADVKAGVDAWSRGDYAAAVAAWKGPAAKGDPDALFNLAQAYRLGRGVPEDMKQAELLYAKAAAQGHLKAADNYGLLLFQDGRREQAMPYVTAAAQRGDPRAEYLLGIAHFNGDLVPKDWVRAYALLTLATAAGLPQAAPAIKQMDGYIPLAQRQQAQSLAVTLKQQTDAQRSSQMAAADLGAGDLAEAAAPPAQVARALPAERVPEPIAPIAVPPSVVAAQAAVAEAMRASGTESPATAGADFARPSRPARVHAPATTPPATSTASAPVVPRPTPPPAAAAPASTGPWKVQLGAFSVPGNAQRLWSQLSGRAPLAGKTRIVESAGRLTKLYAGGFASQAAAQSACSALKAGGHDCIVTR